MSEVYWGPETWGSVDGRWFEVWKPERVIFSSGEREVFQERPEPSPELKPEHVQHAPPSPALQPLTRRWRERHWLKIEDWRLDPHRSRWLRMRGDYGLPREGICWWEAEPWEPDSDLSDGEILEAKRTLAMLARLGE